MHNHIETLFIHVTIMKFLKSLLVAITFTIITTILTQSNILFGNHDPKLEVSEELWFFWKDNITVSDRVKMYQAINAIPTTSSPEKKITSNAASPKRTKSKLILMYTPLFGNIPWPSVPYTYNFTDMENKPCPTRNCKVTYDKRLLPESDLVVFHGRDLPAAEELHRLRGVNLQQIWGFLIHESPQNSHFHRKHYNGLFNWTITYRGDSDYYMPYKSWRRREEKVTQHRNYAKEKTKLIAFVNSHCDDLRMEFIRKLKKLIPVDVYGLCSMAFQDKVPECPRKTKICDDIQRQYKFYLAFENGFCRDYITEKYWVNGLVKGLVPVVIGGANYSDTRIAIKGSFINLFDFNSLRTLADYLLYLDKNDTAYNKYHEWRSEYEFYEGNAMCNLCELINQEQPKSKTIDMVKFWEVEENCWDAKPSLRRFFDADR